jgi:Ca2+-binding RTX toxin-like protein
MATQTITNFGNVGGAHFFSLYSGIVTLTASSHLEARFDDPNSLGYYIIKGEGFEYADGVVSSGVVKSITFFDGSGNLMSETRGISRGAEDIYAGGLSPFYLLQGVLDGADKVTGSGASEGLYGFQGRDVINGRGGNDFIEGDEGADTMTGGRGADDFYFGAGDRRNVITDFDSDGPRRTHDHIRSAFAEDYDVIKSGRDTVIRFDDGSDVRLLDFRPSELDRSDIILAF